MNKIKSYLPQIVAMLFLTVFAAFAWSEPPYGGACTNPPCPPGGNVPAPLNVGANYQEKIGPLVINRGGALTGLVVENGVVGIGTLSPGAKLDVVGDIKAASLISSGGSALPSCALANRGQQFLLQGGAGIEDGFYICKKKTDGTYAWIALGSPTLVKIWDEEKNYVSSELESGWFTAKSFNVPANGKQIVCALRPPVNFSGGTCPGTQTVHTRILYKGSNIFVPYVTQNFATATTTGAGGGLLELQFQKDCGMYGVEGTMTITYRSACYYTAPE